MHGLWFVRGDLVRDFLALNKVDILPWDHGWGHLAGEKADAYPLMDRIAHLHDGADASFDEIRALFASDPGFTPHRRCGSSGMTMQGPTRPSSSRPSGGGGSGCEGTMAAATARGS